MRVSSAWIQPALTVLYFALAMGGVLFLARLRSRKLAATAKQGSAPATDVLMPAPIWEFAGRAVAGYCSVLQQFGAPDAFEHYNEDRAPELPIWATRLRLSLSVDARMAVISTLLATAGIGMHRDLVDRTKATYEDGLHDLTVTIRNLYFEHAPCKYSYEWLLQDPAALFGLVRHARDSELGDRMVAAAVYYAEVFNHLVFEQSEAGDPAERFRIVGEETHAYLLLLNSIARSPDEHVSVPLEAWQQLARLTAQLQPVADDAETGRFCARRDEIVYLYFDEELPADRQEELIELLTADLSFRLLALDHLSCILEAVQGYQVASSVASYSTLRPFVRQLRDLAGIHDTCRYAVGLAEYEQATRTAHAHEERFDA